MNVRYAVRVAETLVRHPVESVTRIRQRNDLHRLHADNRVDYQPSIDWERDLHSVLGLPASCPDGAGFAAVYEDLAQTLPGFPWADDADPALARALWCLTRHVGATKVVETGVARGVSSRFILEALATNGSGHLWSVDLPPLLEGFHASVGAAVPHGDRERWTYIRGASRRELPGLFATIAPIDLFVQDSVGTRPTVLAELDLAWRAVRPGGFLVVNAVNRSDALAEFMAANPPSWHVVGRAAPKPAFEDPTRLIAGQFAILRR
jgi:predicted O-methyltransferase YrrM